MKRFYFLLWLLLSVVSARAANPGFGDFLQSQFDVTGNKIKLRSGALVTNLTFNSFTICDPGTTNCTTYNWPLTNYTSGQFLTVITNGTNVFIVGTNLPVATVVFDTIEELVATPIPLPGIGLLAYVRDPLRGGPLAFYPNSVDTTNRFDTYASLDGPGNWKRPPDPNVYPQHGVVTGGVVTNETLVAALVLQSARAVGKVVYSGTDEFLETDDVPLLDNNVLYGEDGAQATGLVLSSNGKTNVSVYGMSFIAAVADPSIGAFYLTNSFTLIQSPSFVGYSLVDPIVRVGTVRSIQTVTLGTSGMVISLDSGGSVIGPEPAIWTYPLILANPSPVDSLIIGDPQVGMRFQAKHAGTNYFPATITAFGEFPAASSLALTFGDSPTDFPISMSSGGIVADGLMSSGRMLADTSFELGLSGVSVAWLIGAGSPEGVISARVGSLYSRNNGSTSTTLYVKETGAAGNTGWVAVSPGAGGAVATDAIWDAKGDLAGGTGANTAARLAVGSNGQVLTADSAEVTGLKWTTVAGTGDFVGPGDSADTEVVLFDGATGKLGKRSVVKIGSAGAVTGVESISVTNSVQADGFFTGSGSFDAAGLLPGVNIDMESNDIVGVDALIFDNSATLTGNVAVSIPSLIVTNAVIAGGFTNTATAFASGHWNATEFYPDGPINMDGFDIDMVSGTLLMDSGDITLVDDLVFDVGGSITGDASLALPSAVITNALTAGTLGVDGTSTFGAQASANSIWITNSVDRSIRTLTTTTPTLDLSLEGHQYITLSGNTTVTLANSPSGTKQRAVYLHVLGDAARTIAFAGVTVNWLTAQHSPPPATWIAYRFEWDGNEVQGATEAPLLVSELPTSALVQTIGITVDGGGSTITAGQKGYIEVPYACTINRVTMLADQSGSIVIDIWKDTYANYPPTVADTITASAKPTITTAVKSQDATLTGWTTSVVAGDVLGFNVDSASTITRLTLTLKVTKN